MRTRVKICGVTNAADAKAATAAGADAIGLLFHPPAPAFVSLSAAEAVARATPPFVDLTAVFVDPDPAFAREVIAACRPGLLQFHGDEAADFCLSFGLPYLKVARPRRRAEVAATARAHPRARGILLDTPSDTVRGGAGAVFDWERIPPRHPAPLVIAGGLSPDNVGDLIRRCRPWGVDVSSGVCRAGDRRKKDKRKIAAFFAAVAAADGAPVC